MSNRQEVEQYIIDNNIKIAAVGYKNFNHASYNFFTMDEFFVALQNELAFEYGNFDYLVFKDSMFIDLEYTTFIKRYRSYIKKLSSLSLPQESIVGKSFEEENIGIFIRIYDSYVLRVLKSAISEVFFDEGVDFSTFKINLVESYDEMLEIIEKYEEIYRNKKGK